MILNKQMDRYDIKRSVKDVLMTSKFDLTMQPRRLNITPKTKQEKKNLDTSKFHMYL